MRWVRSRTVQIALALVLLTGLAAPASAGVFSGSLLELLQAWILSLRAQAALETPRYRAVISRTSGGIPHIKAQNWGSLGYGYGYAFAQDNFCVLMREVLVATGTLSKYFGPGGGNLDSDVFYRYWSTPEVADEFLASLDPDLQELGRGYAAGLNRFLSDKTPSGLAEDCRDAPWVRPISITDLFQVYHKLVTRAGAPNLLDFIVDAEPPPALSAAPAEASPPAGAPPAPWDAPETLAGIDPQRIFPWDVERVGSNMIGLGRDATENGRGMLLVNPHFPWEGALRFYQVHLTIPGKIDSMGGSIYGSPLPNIAFNKDVAWSHTVSAARRFALYRLTLAPGDPTSYMVDGVVEPMTQIEVTVPVLQNDGSIADVTDTIYETRYGPVADLIIPLDWNNFAAYAVKDVNRENTRIFTQYLRMNRARSLAELVEAIGEEVALPWINTVAVDRDGNAWYGDVGSMPNLSSALLAACGGNFLGLFFLDGSRSDCLLGSDADAPAPEILGFGNLPNLFRDDYVQNSNDSYWLTHPDELLEGFSPILGGERQQQGMRTRLGIQQIEARLAGSDGKPGNLFNLDRLRETVYDNRNLTGEMEVDDVVSVCSEEPSVYDLNGTPVDTAAACDVLAAWDRSNNTDSVGTHVWKEFWTRFDDTVANAWTVPFDVNDPVNTPRDIDETDPDVRMQVMRSLAGAVDRIDRLGVPIDAAWGEVQFEVKDGERLPISGGAGGEGVYNAIGSSRTNGVGYSPVTSGSSIFEVITFDARGPVATGVMTYSQSTDPANPHFGDQTRLFSQGLHQRLPFHPYEIRGDPEYHAFSLRERRSEWQARRNAAR